MTEDNVDVREMIIALRGGVPAECDFCGKATAEDDLHPEEAGQWACIYCINKWAEEDKVALLLRMLTVWMEAHFVVGEATQTARAVTGEPYVVLQLGTKNCIKEEGVSWHADHCSDSYQDMMKAMKTAFTQYIADKGEGAVLYWRAKPEIVNIGNGTGCIRVRLLVSNHDVECEQVRMNPTAKPL
jgi:hypothetical protein